MMAGQTALSQRIGRHWVIAGGIILALGAFAGVVTFVIYGGLYNIAADAPHTQPVYWVLETARDRSIAVRARDIAVPPDLGNPRRIAAGGAEYMEMCAQCHLAPGMKMTDVSQGLYPRAPDYRKFDEISAAEQFWVVKHGIKMTGMPAWGATHDDKLLWDMVAFLQKVPNLTPEEYQRVVKSAPADHDEMMRDMPGMAPPARRPEAH
jgi:mono/diheme cytochrome c family protein